MRLKLLWSPADALERLAYRSRQRRRLKKLRGTVAQGLAVGHIESLELLESVRPLGIRTIYDIGANVGTWALLARAVIPEATVESFEPLPRHCAEFGENLGGVERVRLHPIALGSEDVPATLRVTNRSDASSMLRLTDEARSQFGLDESDEVGVEVRRLDDYRADHELAFPDLIKLDVQGYELQVLEGAPQCLWHAKAVMTEVSFAEYYEGQCMFHDLVDFLAERGLYLSVLSEHTRTAAALSQADALFVRRA